MDKGIVRFPSSADDENAMRFSNMTPMIQIPADIIIQRIEREGLVHLHALLSAAIL